MTEYELYKNANGKRRSDYGRKQMYDAGVRYAADYHDLAGDYFFVGSHTAIIHDTTLNSCQWRI